MLPDHRRRLILEYVLERDVATIAELADKFSTSSVTVHRDLEQLAGQGLLRKVRGGATARSNRIFETSLALRAQHMNPEKRQIAQYALRYVTDGMSLILDNSTTTLAFARLLRGFRDLTVVTYFEEIIRELSQPGYSIRVISTGGELNRTHQTLLGPMVEDCLSRLHVDAAFLSAPAVHPTLGIMHQYDDECRRKQLILSVADEATLLADHGKFQQKALHVVAPLNRVKRVITDRALDATIADAILRLGVDLQVVNPTAPAHSQIAPSSPAVG
jgi:DeoR/GlpR family transcriptional regulator of sugar metabolism